MRRLQTASFDTGLLYDDLRQRAGEAAGAIVTFTGHVRDFAPNLATRTLFLEHYPGMCEREIETICETARQRWDVAEILAVHRYGELHHKEQIVFIAVASAHRGEAFQACEYVIDALKTRAPFWKRETLADGRRFWVEQRESDASKTDQWNTETHHDTKDTAP